MTENEKLFVEVARELKKLLDVKNTTIGMGEVSLRGYFPEALWNKLHFKAGVFLSNDLEGQAAREQAESVEDRLQLQLNTLKVQVAALSSTVETMQQPSCKPSYDRLEARVAALEQVEKRSAEVMQEIAQEVVTGHLNDEDSWKDYLHDLVSKCVDDVDLDSYVATYLRDKGYVTEARMIGWVREYVSERVSDVEDEKAFERRVEVAVSSLMEESYKVPEDYTALHRKFHALLKHHLGKLARGQS